MIVPNTPGNRRMIGEAYPSVLRRHEDVRLLNHNAGTWLTLAAAACLVAAIANTTMLPESGIVRPRPGPPRSGLIDWGAVAQSWLTAALLVRVRLTRSKTPVLVAMTAASSLAGSLLAFAAAWIAAPQFGLAWRDVFAVSLHLVNLGVFGGVGFLVLGLWILRIGTGLQSEGSNPDEPDPNC